ncbi:MAG: substrate-binding domain-containing protein [Spirochaetales bacterium]|nr:substrate-binding domain-containing protein [Spirochaetales bacterium]
MKLSRVLAVVAVLLAVTMLAFGQSKDPYRVFNQYRAMAASGRPYRGAPLKGKVIGFANIVGVNPFCIAVEADIKEHLQRAGLDLSKGWISMDNQNDPAIGLTNARLMLAKKPDFFIEFQVDPLVNNIVAVEFGAAGIPGLAIDVPVPGYPYMGIDNYRVALIAGRTMAALIREKWGGWDGVEVVFLGRLTLAGEAVQLRVDGVAQALAEEFGIQPDDPKIVHADLKAVGPEEQGWGFAEVLASHPEATRIAATATNEEFMAAMISAMQTAGRWDRDNTIIVTLGCDTLGQFQVREGLVDAAVAFFPERYGEYIVPAVCATLTGNPVPPYIFVENEVITRANIDRWYPRNK